jgi:hypothetical protein
MRATPRCDGCGLPTKLPLGIISTDQGCQACSPPGIAMHLYCSWQQGQWVLVLTGRNQPNGRMMISLVTITAIIQPRPFPCYLPCSVLSPCPCQCAQP